MSTIWGEIKKISKKPFTGIKELTAVTNKSSIATTNIDKLLDIHDQHILGNSHKTDDSKSEDILELLDCDENT